MTIPPIESPRSPLWALLAFAALLAAGLSGHALAQKGDPERGRTKASACTACHGSAEREPLPLTPSLDGQQAEFLVLQMILLREGLRDVPQMAESFRGMRDPDLIDIAAHYARLAPPPAARANPALREKGAQIAKAMGCGSCHLPDYRGQNQVPRVAGQREDYLFASLRAYRDDRRTGIDTSMNGILYRVPDGDLRALAHYLAAQ